MAAGAVSVGYVAPTDAKGDKRSSIPVCSVPVDGQATSIQYLLEA